MCLCLSCDSKIWTYYIGDYKPKIKLYEKTVVCSNNHICREKIGCIHKGTTCDVVWVYGGRRTYRDILNKYESI